jgi:hypothetical protein
MVIPAVVGALLILIGIAVLIVDLIATNHGLPAALGVVMMFAGGLVLVWAGVPYSGVLLGAIVAVAALLGGLLLGVLGSSRALRGRRALTGKEGMIGEVGTIRSPVGAVHGLGVRARRAVEGPAGVRSGGNRPAGRRADGRGGQQGNRGGLRRARYGAGGASAGGPRPRVSGPEGLG